MNDSIPFDFETSGFRFRTIPWEQRYFNDQSVIQESSPITVDDEGIIGSAREQRVIDSPLRLSIATMNALDQFVKTQDQQFLLMAIRHAERMISSSHKRDGAMYLPYMYTWFLHRFADAEMEKPWFSSMAQG